MFDNIQIYFRLEFNTPKQNDTYKYPPNSYAPQHPCASCLILEQGIKSELPLRFDAVQDKWARSKFHFRLKGWTRPKIRTSRIGIVTCKGMRHAVQWTDGSGSGIPLKEGPFCKISGS